jgi:23S rRNA pseudouridine2604 synthase
MIRINRFFTDNGICSRREADRYVDEGRVRINERLAIPGDKVGTEDKIYLDGKLITSLKSEDIVVAFHKPVGVECTSDPRVADNIIKAVNYPERLFHIGRLDKMSEGLILLTNIGDLVNAVLRKVHGHEKEYLVWLNEPITKQKVSQLRRGIKLEDGMTLPCKITQIAENKLLMVLVEGKNRQIRRMVEAVGLRVSRLKRVRFMNVKLGNLPSGKWKRLEGTELEQLLSDAKIEIKT